MITNLEQVGLEVDWDTVAQYSLDVRSNGLQVQPRHEDLGELGLQPDNQRALEDTPHTNKTRRLASSACAN